MNPYRKLVTIFFALVIFGAGIVSSLTDGVQQAAAKTSATNCWISYTNNSDQHKNFYLNAIDAISANDVWAVGTSDRKTLTMHWDGTQWSVVPSPSIENIQISNRLTDVSGVSPNDVWAVGSVAGDGFPNASSGTLTLHWDGTAWTSVNSGERFGYLNAVSALRSDNVWAVGDTGRGQNGDQPFIMHWDGTQWDYTDAQKLHINGYMEGVFALAEDDVWAVGSSILHWDGTKWNIVLSYIGDLYAVSASAPDDVWVVGTRSTRQSPVIHWDGQKWSNISITGDGSSRLISVTAIARDNAWAVGEGGQVFHWDGSVWQNEANLPVPQNHMFSAITNAGGSLWISGFQTVSTTDGSGNGAIILQRTSTLCVQPTQMPPPAATSPQQVPGMKSRLFQETGQNVTGIFLDYWNSHGGVMQQGYPISSIIGEVSPLDGYLYAAQYFERAVFEYHPENKAPYDILLSQLGTFEYKRNYPVGAFNQNVNKEGRYLYFPDTGHYVGGAFLDYWQKNGSLSQQGLPISDEFTEVSALDGKPYTVQYFERAVFEDHPENEDQYRVLLSHLGRFSYNAKYEQSTAFTSDTKPETIGAAMADRAVATDRYLFWVDNGDLKRPYLIYGYDLAQKRKFLVSDTAAKESYLTNLTANDQTLVWFEDGNDPHVHSYDISSNKETLLLENLKGGHIRDIKGLALDGNTLYYGLEFHQGLFARNLSTGADRLISAKGSKPVAADGKLLWIEPPDTCSYCTSSSLLHLKALDESISDKVIAQSGDGGFTSYEVSGGNVVWGDYSWVPGLYKISTDKRYMLNSLRGSFPVIKGDLSIWASDNSDPAIKIYNVSTGRLTRLLQPTGPWITPQGMLGNGKIAYGAGDNSMYRLGNSSLFIVDIGKIK